MRQGDTEVAVDGLDQHLGGSETGGGSEGATERAGQNRDPKHQRRKRRLRHVDPAGKGEPATAQSGDETLDEKCGRKKKEVTN